MFEYVFVMKIFMEEVRRIFVFILIKSFLLVIGFFNLFFIGFIFYRVVSWYLVGCGGLFKFL